MRHGFSLPGLLSSLPIQNNPLIIPDPAFFFLFVCVVSLSCLSACGGPVLPCFGSLVGYVCCVVCVWWGMWFYVVCGMYAGGAKTVLMPAVC